VNEKEAGFLFFLGTLIIMVMRKICKPATNSIKSSQILMKSSRYAATFTAERYLAGPVADIEKRYGETAASLTNCKLKLSKNAKVWTRLAGYAGLSE